MKLKRYVSILGASIVFFNFINICAFADDNVISLIDDNLCAYENTETPLYNVDNQRIASYYETTDGGYAILDNYDNIIEYSYEKQIDDYEKDDVCYYAGPGGYYTSKKKSDKKIKDVMTGESIEKNLVNEFQSVDDDLNVDLSTHVIKVEQSEIDNKKSATITYPDSVKDPKGKDKYTSTFWNSLSLRKKNNLSHNTRFFSYNTKGTCGSTASAIMFYYYDNINKSYIKTDKYKGTAYNNQLGFVNHFKSLLGDDGSGTGYDALKKELINI